MKYKDMAPDNKENLMLICDNFYYFSLLYLLELPQRDDSDGLHQCIVKLQSKKKKNLKYSFLPESLLCCAYVYAYVCNIG